MISMIRKKEMLDNPVAKKQDEVVYFEFQKLGALPGVRHLFSSRIGGVSKDEFSSMNLSFTRGDSREAVEENYRRIAKIMHCSPEDMVATYQTHTDQIRIVTREDRGHGVTREKTFFDIDGLLTQEPGVCLVAYFADCVPLFFADPVKKVVGISHSGWKGTLQGIGAKTVQKMVDYYGCEVKNIYAAIGPSICQSCYEVSEDLLVEFAQHFWPVYQREGWKFEVPISAAQIFAAQISAAPISSVPIPEGDKEPALFWNKGNGKYQLNLWEANRLVLLKAGILPENLEMTNLCTCCNPELLFSHRATGGKRGNLCGFISVG